MRPFRNSGPAERVNDAIRATELRVITDTGDNLGVLSRADALAQAREMGLDLIEISPDATPPVAKIMDYGKHRYQTQKKQRGIKAKSKATETKNVQVKIGTGDHDLALKAKKASEWLADGHRIKFDLYLRGRSKYLDKQFLEARMERLLKLLTEEYTIAEPAKQSPKGLTMVIERSRKQS